ncbi:beta-glucosidase [Belliella sp. DSM 111904]|uniref:Beta-glucosidase n=1 Tax=Belliella filtrata TaxID=2923435 RepID=A0ABS9UXV3_9BACT|nr:glucoamylase family protein [Belliella filtrata]MCH7408578.1 beta-glucosidase [Belliella filtrata]
MRIFSTIILAMFVWMVSCGQRENNTTTEVEETKISDDSLMTLVQYRTFQYFWDGAEPTSLLARERIHLDGEYPENDRNVITTGGSGFGVMAILVGIERGFITRKEGFERLNHIVDYLEKADRFHGIWSHWIHGETGKVKPFGYDDDGGDVVESAFLIQGLLTVRQYFKDGNEEEQAMANKITKLYEAMEWSWYRNEKEEVMLWHWSPQYEFKRNHGLKGYDETMIAYILAASSPTYPVDASYYHKGWARDGAIKGESEPFGHLLELNHNGAKELGGPLFWAHYSYLALDPRGLKDQYADYWRHNVNHTLANRAWCLENPNNFEGYGPHSWGLTASYSVKGYAAHAPGDNSDKGVISPTAALSSFPYTPEHSMEAMRYWYETYGDKLFGKYGFYDAFSVQEDWFPQRYLAIDQGPIVVMIENHRTGLLWDLFMTSPEVKEGLDKLGFSSPHYSN